MQKYNISFKIENISQEKMEELLKMLSVYYILQHQLPVSKMETIATVFYPVFLHFFLCRLN